MQRAGAGHAPVSETLQASNSWDHPGSWAPRPQWQVEELGFGESSSSLFVRSAADILMCLIAGVAPHLLGGC